MREKLTSREQQILEMLLKGISPDEIADRLHISKDTVQFHQEKLYHKLGVHSISGNQS